MSARRTSVEADCERCFVDSGGVVVLVTEWDREISLGVVMGESEGDFGESGKSLVSVGVFLVVVGEGLVELVFRVWRVILWFFSPP